MSQTQQHKNNSTIQAGAFLQEMPLHYASDRAVKTHYKMRSFHSVSAAADHPAAQDKKYRPCRRELYFFYNSAHTNSDRTEVCIFVIEIALFG